MVMMSRTGRILMGLLLGGLLSAVMSASASAQPIIVNKEGKFPIKPKFASTSGKGTFETVSGERLVCKEDTNTGEFTGFSTAKLTVRFTGCEAFGIKCSTAGAKEGEIVVFATGHLVYILRIPPPIEVGLLIETEEVSIKCLGTETFKVKGSAVGRITPILTLAESLTLKFSQSKGVQNPVEYESKEGEKAKATLAMSVKGGEFKQTGLETEDKLRFEEEVEIKE
jgi:hypothetical protein